MRNQTIDTDLVSEPLISADKIIKRAKELGLRQVQMAKLLGESDYQMSRGLRKPKWLAKRITHIAEILQTNAADLVEEAPTTSLMQRVCGIQTERGMLLPVGCEIRMLFLNTTVGWSMYLVAPGDAVAIAHDDYVMLEMHDGSLRAGRYQTDARTPTIVRIVSDDPAEHPKNIEKSAIKSTVVIVAPLGWTGVKP